MRFVNVELHSKVVTKIRSNLFMQNVNTINEVFRRMGRLLFSIAIAIYFLLYIIFDMSDTNKKKKEIYLHCLDILL